MRKFCTILVAVLVLALQAVAQNRTVNGTVSDDKGNPVSDATVSVKETKIATTTNSDGRFKISIPSTVKSLVVSYVGMGETELKLTSNSDYSVTLTSSTRSLDEVVVVGYGSQKKIEQTGAISTIAGKDMENRPFTSFDKMLQGEVAGLQSVAGSGQPGATQNVRLRGIGSIAAGSAPLYVIDGVQVTPGDISRLTTTANTFAGINPNDIESISVLKDAASTSIYGSQAANGVILITTKKGRAGKPKFRFDAEFGQNDFAYYNDDYKPLNAAEWAMISKEGLVNAGQRVGQADTLVNTSSTYGAYSRGYNTDWLSLLTRNGQQHQYNLSASGGSDKGTFYVSGGYYKEDGTAIQSDFKRYTAAIRGRNYLTNKFTITTDLSIGVVNQTAPPNGSGFANPIYEALVLQPTRPAYNPDGSINISDFDFQGLPFNALYLSLYDKRKLVGIKGVGNVSGEYKILPNLKFTSRFGIDYNNLEESQFQNPNHGDGRTDGGRGYSYYTRQFSWTWTNFADYSQSFLNDKIKADLKVGYEAYKVNIINNSLRADGFPPALELTLAGNGSTPKTASAIANDKTRASAFSGLNLNFNDRYILSGSFRRDGSSVFSMNNRYGNFWSIGGAWNIDREKWFANVRVINQLKLRSSYGTNGNESGFGYYVSLQTYGYTGNNYNLQPGSAPNNVGDPTLTWELNKPFNIGVDVSLLKNRLSFTAEYYDRKTTNLLLDANTSRTTGFSTYTTNIGAMQNKGVELSIKATPIRSQDFNWDVNFNFARNKNTLSALYQDKDITSGSFIRSVGYDYQTFYTRLWAGVDPANGDPLWYKDDSKSETTNNILLATLVKFGSATPKFFGGFSNTFSYKGLSLDIQFNYSGGNYLRDALGSLYLGDGTSPTRNKVKKQLERWQKPGDITEIPKFVNNGNKNSSSFSTRYLFKADYIRLRNLQLAYTLPISVAEKFHLTGFTFYVRGSNMLTWVKDKDLPWDPEQGISSETNGEVFIPRTMSVGVNVNF